jgi:hypothetical protein
MDFKPELILVNPWMMLPFGILLAAIALAPLFFSVWWGAHYPKVAGGLAAFVVGYYFIGLHAGAHLGQTAHDYLSFIALVGSLFVVSGGIHINVKGEATPLVNVIFLLFGAVAANLFGTTGASMVLIRPWRPPRRVFHFHRFQRRRLPHADWGSSAFSRLFDGRAVLVGDEALPADVGRGRGNFVADVFRGGFAQLSAGAPACARGTDRARRMAVRWIAKPLFPGGDHRGGLHQQTAVPARGPDGRGGGGIVFYDTEAGA